MLVLSRRCGEKTMIGDTISVMVLEVRGERVKLGFTGPTEVPIHREEVYRTIARRQPVCQPALVCGGCP